MKAIKSILEIYPKAALLIGNGPNLAADIMPSWKELLIAAGNGDINIKTRGLSNTEIYDLVQLHSSDSHDVKGNIQAQLEIEEDNSLEIHKRLMKLALDYDAPVLTTNFDAAFEKSIDAEIYRTSNKGFTHFYPWTTYYGTRQLEDPTEGFGIWKVHGDVRYKKSIRLGLTDYMGSAERARRLIHKGPGRLFVRKRFQWQGHKTWLHIWFNLPIVIFGLNFGGDEVFLRWLLIERKAYKDLRNDPMDVWYISKGTPEPSVKNLMDNLSVDFKTIENYSELYD